MAPKKSAGKHPQKLAEIALKERRTKYKEDVSAWAEQVVEE